MVQSRKKGEARMILDNILENDLNNCGEVINKDKKLMDIDAKFYDLLDEVDDALKPQLEKVYEDYTTRAIRLAYLQGLKDFNELCIVLREDTDKIIEELSKALREN